MKTRSVMSRRGFTLVEMLVVIAIIGILVALLIPAVATVMWRVRNAAIATEMQDLARAIEAYKSFTNDYPPDFTNSTALANHISKSFPRNTRTILGPAGSAWFTSGPPSWPTSPNAAPNPVDLDPAEALVFWLSLLSTNPRDPLGGTNPNYSGERKVLFEFKSDRLVDLDQDGWLEYVPQYGKDQPYVYFDGRVVSGMYAYATAVYPKQAVAQPAPVSPPPTAGVVRPYRSNTIVDVTRDSGLTQPYATPSATENNTQWMNPGRFQIVCAGQDNEWGVDNVSGTTVVFKTYPELNYNIKGPDEDNLADFAEMKTLGDSVP